MRKILLPIAMVAMLVSSSANADVIATWTFETSVPTTAGPLAPEVGAGSATAFHADGTTTYSNPVGNGSGDSWSSNTWTAGDYYQFSVSTVGLENIQITWDQTGSNTGPRDFNLEYDAGGGFMTATSYALTNDGWSSGTNNPDSTRTFDFSAITALDDNATVIFRLTSVGNTAINGSPVAVAGSSRVDNVLIEGSAVIPEPTAAGLCLIVLAGMIGRRRR